MKHKPKRSLPMAQIKIEITIPDYEYQEWTDYLVDGAPMVMMNLRKQISDRLRQDWIRHFEIDVIHEE